MHTKMTQLYRERFGDVTGALVRKFGAARLDELESAAQEAFTRAWEKWPKNGEPDDPIAWLIVTARNHFLNTLDRVKTAGDKELAVADYLMTESQPSSEIESRFGSEITDNQLRMLFMCCHPDLAATLAVPLTLRILCGLNTAEIAEAFLVSQDAMEKRLARAKNRLREINPGFDIPPAAELLGRSMQVAKVLYLLFTEGYTSKGQVTPIRSELCHEAIRLAEVFAETEDLPRAEMHALLALMHFQASRLAARLDCDGDLVTLADQDRSLWNLNAVKRGFYFLERSAGGEFANVYHLEALIASCHALAPSYAETDWNRIIQLYDILANANASPIVDFNRAVAIASGKSTEQGLKELTRLSKDKHMTDYFPLHMALLEFYHQSGQVKQADLALEKARGLAHNDAEKRFLAKRAKKIED